MANNLVTNVVRSVAQTIASRQLQKVSGGLKLARGNLGAAANRATSSIPVGGKTYGRSDKHRVNHFSYPSDVDSDPMQGHYVIFNISSLTAAILKSEKGAKDMRAQIKRLQAQYQRENEGTRFLSEAGAKAFVKKHLIVNAPSKLPASKTNRGFGINSMPRTTLETSIALYMPPAVSVNYGINYADQEIGALAEVGTGMIKAFTQGGGDIVSKVGGALEAAGGTAAQEGIQNVLLKSLDVAAPGGKAMFELQTGKVVTPRMELMFKGVGRRSFSFTFAFIPKSAQEAREVENIIYTFKENMHPEYANPTTRKEMKIPNTFEISYMYQNKTNDFLNKISTCFLTSMAVQYGGDRFTAYEPTESRMGEFSGGPPGRGTFSKSPPPQKSQVTLGFTELETLSKQHIKEGY